MFKLSFLKIAILVASFSQGFHALAQKRPDVQENEAPPSGVTIDGNLSEWKEPKFTRHEETRLSYIVSNDAENLYFTIKTNDKDKVSKIIMWGITCTINNEGKKKAGASVIFPIVPPLSSQQKTSKDANQVFRQRLAGIKEIRVKGLENILDGSIALSNEYGIRAAAVLDSTYLFTYELAVPMRYLNLSLDKANAFAVNIKLNGMTIPRMQAPPRSPYEGGARRTYQAPVPSFFKPEEFWFKRTLNNPTK